VKPERRGKESRTSAKGKGKAKNKGNSDTEDSDDDNIPVVAFKPEDFERQAFEQSNGETRLKNIQDDWKKIAKSVFEKKAFSMMKDMVIASIDSAAVEDDKDAETYEDVSIGILLLVVRPAHDSVSLGAQKV
jgi:hypothetical protein